MTKKVDLRDVLWFIIAIVLLSLIGREWYRAHSVTKEVRKLRTIEQPLQFVNAPLAQAMNTVYQKFGAVPKTNWRSLKPLGLDPRTRVTKSIKLENAKQAYEELFGPDVEVVEDVEFSQTKGGPMYFIRAKQSTASK
jgi:hypothetical protein